MIVGRGDLGHVVEASGGHELILMPELIVIHDRIE